MHNVGINCILKKKNRNQQRIISDFVVLYILKTTAIKAMHSLDCSKNSSI